MIKIELDQLLNISFNSKAQLGLEYKCVGERPGGAWDWLSWSAAEKLVAGRGYSGSADASAGTVAGSARNVGDPPGDLSITSFHRTEYNFEIH